MRISVGLVTGSCAGATTMVVTLLVRTRSALARALRPGVGPVQLHGGDSVLGGSFTLLCFGAAAAVVVCAVAADFGGAAFFLLAWLFLVVLVVPLDCCAAASDCGAGVEGAGLAKVVSATAAPTTSATATATRSRRLT